MDALRGRVARPGAAGLAAIAALALLAVLAARPDAAAAAARVSITTPSQVAAAREGRIVVALTTSGRASASISASAITALTATTSAAADRAGRLSVALTLSSRGRARLAGCDPVWVTAHARVREGSRAPTTITTSRVLLPGRASCDVAPLPARGPAGASELSRVLRAQVGSTGIVDHARALARAATANGGNRAAGTAGYAASVRYALATLRAAGLSPRTQRFSLPEFAYGSRVAGPTSTNVIAETRTGDRRHTVVIGAHLDSVPAGPGINDNASGSAALLELARQVTRLGLEPRHRIRFVLFGAEEIGLLGSEAYLRSLSQDRRDDVQVMLNLDMLGSVNFGRLTYGPREFRQSIPRGTARAERRLLDFFRTQGQAAARISADGRSDHAPFLRGGIPAVGLHSGASEDKTRADQRLFGGVAGRSFDPCYHRPCDTLANIAARPLDELTDAAADFLAQASTTATPLR